MLHLRVHPRRRLQPADAPGQRGVVRAAGGLGRSDRRAGVQRRGPPGRSRAGAPPGSPLPGGLPRRPRRVQPGVFVRALRPERQRRVLARHLTGLGCAGAGRVLGGRRRRLPHRHRARGHDAPGRPPSDRCRREHGRRCPQRRWCSGLLRDPQLVRVGQRMPPDGGRALSGPGPLAEPCRDGRLLPELGRHTLQHRVHCVAPGSVGCAIVSVADAARGRQWSGLLRDHERGGRATPRPALVREHRVARSAGAGLGVGRGAGRLRGLPAGRRAQPRSASQLQLPTSRLRQPRRLRSHLPSGCVRRRRIGVQPRRIRAVRRADPGRFRRPGRHRDDTGRRRRLPPAVCPGRELCVEPVGEHRRGRLHPRASGEQDG